MTVIPTYDLENCPQVDILMVPGGQVTQHLGNERLIKWIQATAETAEYVLSVCNGAFYLGQAGLLDGLTATTTAGLHARLQAIAPKANVIRNQRFVDNGKIITTAGLSSGIDGALHLIEKQHGRGWAMLAATGMEYNWQPGSDYTRAMLPDMHFPDGLYVDIIFEKGDLLDMGGDRNHWFEHWQLQSGSPAPELQQKINAWLSEKTDWQRANGVWCFRDELETDWETAINVSPAGDDQLFIDLTIKQID
jgi:putative intracellular protease/amidase